MAADKASAAFWFVTALVLVHVSIIILSNYLVQLPIQLFGFDTTWGSFSFPAIFITTDLTVRLLGRKSARTVIAVAMVPALVASYVVGVLFHEGAFRGIGALCELNGFVLRIAVASFAAYALGQMLDILVFNRVRERSSAWWPAPVLSAVCGEALDSATFFSVAFAGSSNAFMATHWVEMAVVDYTVRLAASLALFVPGYGLLLDGIQRQMRARVADP
ncbi:MAG TPA: 7-cyano-7-deazaguanine/7-aminomethyl-7-deazaguanine transporter [Nevskiaceae bacterium]